MSTDKLESCETDLKIGLAGDVSDLGELGECRPERVGLGSQLERHRYGRQQAFLQLLLTTTPTTIDIRMYMLHKLERVLTFQ